MALDAALAIVKKEGLRGISVRRIADRMGYAAGTLYHLFEDLDDLVIRMNIETLELLHARVLKLNLSGPPEATLIEMAGVYIDTVNAEPKRWNAVFEYNPPIDYDMPAEYHAVVGNILGLVEQVLRPLFADDEGDLLWHEARVMWASLYGIATLASSRKSSVRQDTAAMVRSLATNYVWALRARKRAASRKRA